MTAQKRHPRVHTSPRSITVAVPSRQHSPTLGQRASSQTVKRFELAERLLQLVVAIAAGRAHPEPGRLHAGAIAAGGYSRRPVRCRRQVRRRRESPRPRCSKSSAASRLLPFRYARRASATRSARLVLIPRAVSSAPTSGFFEQRVELVQAARSAPCPRSRRLPSRLLLALVLL